MDTDDQIYLGIWTNWSRGSAIMGATLTTTQKSGNILIAFTAIFVPFVASRLWKMLCFAFHTCTSKQGAQDAIYHQRQVVLRNSPSPDSGLLSLLHLAWTWRRLHVKALLRLLPLLVFAILFIVGFTVAGGYSSQITSAMGDEVLINGDDCGFLSWMTNITDMNSTFAINSWAADKINDASNYVQQCYASQGTNLFDCDRFVVQSLPTTTDSNYGCPFASDICHDNATNIRLDTGYLDSNNHLGLNAPYEQRFIWRQVLSCAPLKTSGYTSSHIHNNQTFVRYNYGGFSSFNATLNYTYSVPDLQAQYAQWENTIDGLNFRLSLEQATSFNGSLQSDRSFTPSHAITPTDGELVLIFLSGNGVRFIQESNDSWYKATRPYGTLSMAYNTAENSGVYIPTDAASPLGCKQQFQWCNPEYGIPGGCGPLAGLMDATAGAYPFFNMTVDDYSSGSTPSTERGVRVKWSANIDPLSKLGIFNILLTLGAKALSSQKLLTSGVQLGIAENQWHLDVMNWWNMTLAIHQAAFIDTALGYRHADANLKSFVNTPVNDYERHLCRNQKVRRTGYASFSLFGLLFTYILGALIVLMSFALDPIMRCLHTRRQYRQYQYLEWRTNGALQLHRLAQDELGYGNWSGCTDNVPVTRSEDRLADLDIGDLEYPKLNREAVEAELKPEQVSSNAGTVVALQGCAEASDDAVTNVDAEHTFHQPARISVAEDVSNSFLSGQERLGSHRVSMVSMEDTDYVQMAPNEPIPGNGQGANARR
ncbi:hypothetical protein PG996_004694 [Apiospora saccharicola]|uniref:Uncharacterized protein n=1 Tax=Apiospora saccharicola TaxID=335842 RepID=A0ABR1W4W4_9PEZI